MLEVPAIHSSRGLTALKAPGRFQLSQLLAGISVPRGKAKWSEGPGAPKLSAGTSGSHLGTEGKKALQWPHGATKDKGCKVEKYRREPLKQSDCISIPTAEKASVDQQDIQQEVCFHSRALLPLSLDTYFLNLSPVRRGTK